MRATAQVIAAYPVIVAIASMGLNGMRSALPAAVPKVISSESLVDCAEIC